MDFGTIIPGTARSRIRINPNDASTTVLGDALLVGGTVTTGDFRITGTADERVRITISQNRIDLVRDGGTETMRVNRFRLDGGRNRFLNAVGEASVSVGGQLRVEPNQAAGIYRGTFNVSVDYF